MYTPRNTLNPVCFFVRSRQRRHLARHRRVKRVEAVEEALRLQRGVEAFDPVLWRESRDLVLASVRAFFAAAEPRLDLPCAVQSSACGNESEACMQVLVLDDNMHYRSMRRCPPRPAPLACPPAHARATPLAISSHDRSASWKI